MVACFFGHGNVDYAEDIKEKFKKIVENEIIKGVDCFLIGIHGNFDMLALSVCRGLKEKYDIKICLVFTSLSLVLNKDNKSYLDIYKDCEIITYVIEDEYYKNKIISSNKHMVRNSDLVICYLRKDIIKSGAKIAIAYAKKLRKKVINIFEV